MQDTIELIILIPEPVPLPIAQEASVEIERRLAARDIELLKQHKVIEIKPDTKKAIIEAKDPLGYDLFVGVPIHKTPQVVRESVLGQHGWIPVNKVNLETSLENVYAVGDVTKIPVGKFAVPKAGAFAETGARVVVNDILNKIYSENNPVKFEGMGSCYLEFGAGQVAKLNANFLGKAQPEVRLDGPSAELRPDKQNFEKDRIAKWFK